MSKRLIISTLSVMAAVAAGAIVDQTTRQFVVDGNVISANVLQENGHYWVSLDDVGRYFGYFVSVNASQANLTKIPTAPAPGTAAPTQGVATAPSTTTTSGTGAPLQFAPGTSSTPNPSPMQITVGEGQTASVGGYDFKVDDIRDAGQHYKETFDQRGTVLHTKFKTDTLAVVDIEETNPGTQPMKAVIPDGASVTVFDDKKVGYSGSFLDVWQSSAVINKTSDDSVDIPDLSGPSITLGPGGTVKFAIIASVPAHTHVSSVLLNITGNDPTGSSATAMVTVSQ